MDDAAARIGRGPAGAERGPASSASLTLFNPSPLLKLLYILFYPFQMLHPLVIPVVLMAGLTMLQNWQALGAGPALGPTN